MNAARSPSIMRAYWPRLDSGSTLIREISAPSAERASAGRASAKARGNTGGRPRTDIAKLRDAKVLYDNSGKTADEVCKVVGVGRRIFFAYLAQQRDQQSTTPIAN